MTPRSRGASPRGVAWTDYELHWARGRYRILVTPTGPWAAEWDALERRAVHESEPDPPPPWAFERRELRTEPVGAPWLPRPLPPYGHDERHAFKVFRIAWPPLGVFVPDNDRARSGPPAPYNPIAVANAILLDVQRTSADDPKSLLRFVNRWGVLGVGIPGAPAFPADAVALTREWLARLTGWMEALYALQRRQKTTLTWRALADQLNDALRGAHPAARPAKTGGLEPVFRVERLLDALCVALWEQAADLGHFRRCPECRALFVPGRANQEYCSRLCANRPTVRKWRRAQRRKQQQTRRPKEG